MSNTKPFKDGGGTQKEFSSTDTIPPNNLAPSGNNGDVLTKDNTTVDGQKWAAPSAGGVISLTQLAPTSTQNIPAGYSAVVAGRYKITLGNQLNILLGSKFYIL